MKTTRSGTDRLLRQAAALALGLALLVPAALGKEKAGAHVKLVRKDGTVVEGELLAVKGRDLLLRTYATSEGVTEGIDGLAEVRLVKKARVLRKMGNGFLIGAAAGAGIGAIVGSNGAEHADEWMYIGPRNAAEGALGGGLLVGTLGALIGVTVGALSGHDTTYRIEGTSEGYVNGVLGTLKQKSRSPN